jgi:hypothetical protein
MTVWPEEHHGGAPALAGSEGELVSVSIAIEPRLLEGLLDALAELPFPVNPRISHHPATIVEFPAYAGRLAEIRSLLARRGLAPESVGTRNMLEQIRGQGYNTNW